MRTIVAAASLLLALTTAVPAAADYADEHPEYFGITAPPPTGARLPSPFEHGPRFAVRLGPLDVVDEVLLALAGEKLLFVIAGNDELSQLEAYVEEYPLSWETVGYLDVEELDTRQVGEYFPLLVEAGGKALVVDPRYSPKYPHDDAAGSKLAELWDSCAYRPPIFLTRGYIAVDGEGLCIVPGSLYGRSPGLTAAEVDGQLMAYLGCQQILSVQALQQDGEARLDTFLRLAGPGVFLVGDYTTEQDSANSYLLGQVRAKLAAGLPTGSFTIETIAMPAPIAAGNTTLRPSYLHYLRTGTKLIVPTFAKNENAQVKAVARLQDLYPGLAITTVDSTELTYDSGRLTSLVAPYPDLPMDKACEAPEVKCESGSPLECDLCYNECLKTEKVCVSPSAYGQCAKGEDGCYDLDMVDCPEGFACSGTGLCEELPGECDTMPAGGTCEGDLLKKCVGNVLITTDCAKDNKFCTFDEEGKAICFLPCFDDCTVGTTFCEGDSVYLCEPLPDAGPDCGQRALQETCEEGTVCMDGACATPPVEEGADGGATTDTDTLSPGPVDEGWNAGYKRDDGCGITPESAPLTAVLLALLALLLAALRSAAVRSR